MHGFYCTAVPSHLHSAFHHATNSALGAVVVPDEADGFDSLSAAESGCEVIHAPEYGRGVGQVEGLNLTVAVSILEDAITNVAGH